MMGWIWKKIENECLTLVMIKTLVILICVYFQVSNKSKGSETSFLGEKVSQNTFPIFVPIHPKLLFVFYDTGTCNIQSKYTNIFLLKIMTFLICMYIQKWQNTCTFQFMYICTHGNITEFTHPKNQSIYQTEQTTAGKGCQVLVLM